MNLLHSFGNRLSTWISAIVPLLERLVLSRRHSQSDSSPLASNNNPGHMLLLFLSLFPYLCVFTATLRQLDFHFSWEEDISETVHRWIHIFCPFAASYIAILPCRGTKLHKLQFNQTIKALLSLQHILCKDTFQNPLQNIHVFFVLFCFPKLLPDFIYLYLISQPVLLDRNLVQQPLAQKQDPQTVPHL